jgi:glycerate 2-kinase
LASLIPAADARAPGAGAAGGLGFGLLAFAGARLKSGAELVMDAIGFDRRLEGARLVLTGEGKLDRQSLGGKAVVALARRVARRGVPVVALVGAAGGDLGPLHADGLTAWFSICDGPLDEADSLARAAELLERASEQVVRLFSSATPRRAP